MDTNSNIREVLRLYIYYILIGVISLLSVVVFPILGAGGTDLSNSVAATFPNTKMGWILWIVVRILIVILNMLIFTLFIQQSKVNVKDEPNYKLANEILVRHKPKEYRPRSPSRYLSGVYSSKGISLVFTTAASLFAIGNAVINYDLMLLVATVFTVIISISFGIMTMKKCEVYYITEFLDYAKEIERNKINKGDIKTCLQSMINNIEI